ncbi:hypothetical protein RN001_008724 [Aquatica leii]|uniref:Major facilitator superfamily (MFS) profile domain-containing protein n=1 Tax=Aquatica leii TaxID=1421715 RepID=A0AAN7QJ73_9COLE|nr:hypothetical protein RN001_008724 [Aquatica leii]
MDNKTNAVKSEFRNALPQVLAVFVKNFLMLSFGMNIGFATILIGGLLRKSSNGFTGVTEDQISWIGSMSLLTIPIGSVLSGIITQPLGRKRSMQFITIPFVICWIGFYFSTKMWQLYLALALMGFFGGLVEAPFSAYVSEITEPHLRGVLITSGSIFAILGIFIQFMLGTFYNWRTCAIISCVFPSITFILFCFVPESPYWLLLNNKVEQAKQAFAWLRGWSTVEEIELEIQDIIKQHTKESVTRSQKIFSVEKVKPFLRKSFLWPFGIIAFAFVLSQFSGVPTLQTYAISIFATLNVPINTYYATSFLAATEVVGALVGGVLIHLIGKRKLLFVSLTGGCICNVLIATYAHVNNVKYILLVDENDSLNGLETLNWIPLALLISLSFIVYCGVFFLPWVIIGELYSYETRSVGCGISSAVSYLINFVSNKLYLKMASTITIFGVYLFYGSVCLLGIIIMYFLLPETEGKTLEEITSHFEGLSKLGNNVKRKRQASNYAHVNMSFKDDEVEIVSSKL